MRLLLDAQVWSRRLVSPKRLAPTIIKLLVEEANGLYLSAASRWKIAIKYRRGKLPLPENPERFIAPPLLRDGIRGLRVSVQHVGRVAALPLFHRCPFDRMLVAQAQIEGMTVVSADGVFTEYQVNLIRC